MNKTTLSHHDSVPNSSLFGVKNENNWEAPSASVAK